MGGYDGSSYLNSAEVYDPDHNSWTPIKPMATKRYGVGVAVLQGKLYAVGGTADGRSSLNSAEVYDPNHNSWSPIASMGSKRRDLGVAVLQGKLYAVGGYDGSSYLNSAEVYEPEANSWSWGDQCVRECVCARAGGEASGSAAAAAVELPAH